MALMALAQQGSQIYGIMGQAGIGIRGVGAAFLDMSRSILTTAATNPYILATAAAVGLFVGVVNSLNDSAKDSAAMEEYARSLGLTTKERSEEHTSELQSLMRISYAVFCLNKKKKQKEYYTT